MAFPPSFLPNPCRPARLLARELLEVAGLCPAAHPARCIGLAEVRRAGQDFTSPERPRSGALYLRGKPVPLSAAQRPSGDLWDARPPYRLGGLIAVDPAATTFSAYVVLCQLRSSDRLEILQAAQRKRGLALPSTDARVRGRIPPENHCPIGPADRVQDENPYRRPGLGLKQEKRSPRRR